MDEDSDAKDMLDLRQAKVRKAEFLEAARELMWKDRYDRKVGKSVDTAGAIARAMEKAYKIGRSHAGADAPSNTTAPTANDADASPLWTHLSVRARGAMDSIMRFEWTVVLEAPEDDWSPERWGCYWDWGDGHDRAQRIELATTYALATLAPLIRMGMMCEEADGGHTKLVATVKGLAVWQQAIRDGKVMPPAAAKSPRNAG